MFLRKRRIALLLAGDIFLFYAALVITVYVNYFWHNNITSVFIEHLIPFSYLIAVWIVVFLIAGLYDKETLFFRKKLPGILLGSLAVSGVIAVLFFYLNPFFYIAPKSNLFTYFVFSFVFVLLWRLYGITFLSGRKKQKTLFVGSGRDFLELVREFERNADYAIDATRVVDLSKVGPPSSLQGLAKEIPAKGISLVVIDTRNEKIGFILPRLYELVFLHIRFLDMRKVYEEVFQRIPLSLVSHRWFLEHASSSSTMVYDFLKRFMDLTIGFALGVFSLILYPFIFAAIKLDDGGQIFTLQRRVGKDNKIIRLLKFRTMDYDDGGKWEMGAVNNVTRVGNFLRKTRVDELPQLWNVLYGSISLIGPRPEFPEPVDHYNKKIPYYNIRYLIKPGLSGWAQILHDRHPHHATDVEETAVKLSYDLYYIKNRSILLDIEIALKTIKTFLSRKGV